MAKSLKTWMVVLLAAVLVAELVLPTALSQVLSQSVKEATASDVVSAQLSGRPAILMLAGHFDHIAIQTQNAKLDKVSFSELQADFKNVRLNMTSLLNKQLVIQSVDSIELVATITQEEFERYINANVKGAKGAKVNITPQGVHVTSRLSVGNITMIDVNLDGQVVGDDQKIKFKTDKFAVNNTLVGNLGGAMLTEIPLFDLKKLPFGVHVREIKTETGKIKVYADNHVQ